MPFATVYEETPPVVAVTAENQENQDLNDPATDEVAESNLPSECFV